MNIELDNASLGVSLGAIATALGWALVQRVKKAKHLVPKTRISFRLSMRTHSSDAGPPTASETSSEPQPYPSITDPTELAPPPSEPPLELADDVIPPRSFPSVDEAPRAIHPPRMLPPPMSRGPSRPTPEPHRPSRDPSPPKRKR